MRKPQWHALLALAIPATMIACGGGDTADMEADPADEMATPAETPAETAATMPMSFQATLSGDAAVPPVESTATGTFSMTIEGDQLSYTLEVTGLEGVTAAHIHQGAPGESGGPIVPLEVTTGVATGVIGEGTATLDAAALQAIQAGNAYVNVHTTANSGGEIRGQLQPAGG